MKNILKFAFFAIIICSFYGCPSGLDFPLAEPGKEKIDENILGVWKNNDPETEIQKVEISKKDDFSYSLKVLEKGELYALETDNFTGWNTTLEGKKFIFFKAENDEQYYHYVIKELKGKKMIICDLSLLDQGKEAVNSIETLKKEVISSMQMPEFWVESEHWIKE